MRVWILHQAIQADASPDEQDVLQQVDAVGRSLVRLGHRVEVHACTLDLESLDAALNTVKSDLVFNLVEAVAGAGRLIYLPPALLDARQRPYTGSSAEALFLTSHKILAKERMREAELPTPLWASMGSRDTRGRPAEGKDARSSNAGGRRHTWLVKSVWEHASLGMDDTCLVRAATPAMAAGRLAPFAERMGGECFAEEFIDGREFNVGLLAGPDGPEVLPPAEIVFADFPTDKPRIIGYQAKWATDSFEFQHTARRFAFEAADTALLEEMKRLALQCWDAFGLAGYARVDFRVDSEGNPWILEVNANPCLSPDAGFAAMIERAGLTYDKAVERILAEALTHNRFRRTASARRKMVPTSGVGADRPETPVHAAPAAATTQFTFRTEVLPSDHEAIADLARATGFFHADEVDIAVELVDERLKKGAASGYEFVMAELDGRVVGYTCFGIIPCTRSSYDLYWIAVRPEVQGRGLGRLLLLETERRIREASGTRVYAETSSRPQYLSTRAFYERTGYKLAELLEDFYAPGDGRATYLKVL
jgi:D-alanine-D-alanine ligase-like ATP-grasp enzyme/ribosomal protein S18 acetylase RimI-like enzyme